MSVYIVGAVNITDDAGYQKYRDGVGPILSQVPGVELVSGDDFPIILEGAQPAAHLFIVKFPDQATLEAFYYSEAYTKVKEHRLDSSEAKFMMVMRGP